MPREMELVWRSNASPYPRADSKNSSGAANSDAYTKTSTTNTEARPESVMPKNFAKPLTCFYWNTFGDCNKSDEQCLYAHYHTGLVAAAPVSLNGSKGPVAGRNAMNQLNHQLERGKQSQEWESMLKAKEMELNRRHGDVQALFCAKASLKHLQAIIENGKAGANKAHNALIRSHEQISNPASTNNPDAFAVALCAIEEAAASMTSFEAELGHLAEQTKGGSAGSVGLSGVTLAF